MRARVTSDFLIKVAVVIVLNVFENRMPRTAWHVKDYLNAFISELGLKHLSGRSMVRTRPVRGTYDVDVIAEIGSYAVHRVFRAASHYRI